MELIIKIPLCEHGLAEETAFVSAVSICNFRQMLHLYYVVTLHVDDVDKPCDPLLGAKEAPHVTCVVHYRSPSISQESLLHALSNIQANGLLSINNRV